MKSEKSGVNERLASKHDLEGLREEAEEKAESGDEGDPPQVADLYTRHRKGHHDGGDQWSQKDHQD
jgi:hypothetical protein